MWPWEHLAFGYLLFSSLDRVGFEPPLVDRPVWFLVIGTQFPDLVDKPLAWGVGVLPNGISLAHSVFTTVLLCAVVLALSRRVDSVRSGVAFSVGYASHLAGDFLYHLMVGGSLVFSAFLWPLVERPVESTVVVARVIRLLGGFVGFLGTPLGRLYLAFELLLLGSALLLWLRDGVPGLRWFVRPDAWTARSP